MILKNIGQDDASIIEQQKKDTIEWMQENFVKQLNRSFTINDDGTVDTVGHVVVSDYWMENIPYYVKFNKHQGSWSVGFREGGLRVDLMKKYPYPFTLFHRLPKYITFDILIDMPFEVDSVFPKVDGIIYLDRATKSQVNQIKKFNKHTTVNVTDELTD